MDGYLRSFNISGINFVQYTQMGGDFAEPNLTRNIVVGHDATTNLQANKSLALSAPQRIYINI
jgi:hypothetical protein